MITQERLQSLVILAFAGWNSSSLLSSWTSPHPFFIYGWAAFLIWTAAAAALMLSPLPYKKKQTCPLWLSFIGFALALLGLLSSLNVLIHLGFACAIVALLPLSPFSFLLLASSVAWMPLYAWIGATYFPQLISLSRFFIAGIPLLTYLLWKCEWALRSDE